MYGWAGFAVLTAFALTEHTPPAVGQTDSPRGTLGHRLPSIASLGDQEPVAELRIIAVSLGPLGIGHGSGQPTVVGLAGELEDPARHRDGDPVVGELLHERVNPFPGRFDCDRYAAARRRTSFSCSSSRFRRRSSRSSADSPVVLPGAAPSSMSACRSHFHSVIGCTPKSAAICSIVTPPSRLRATRTTSSRNSFG